MSINLLYIKSINNPNIIPIPAFNNKIVIIEVNGTCSDKKIGNISSEVDKYTAINVPIDIIFATYKFDAEALKPH